MEVRIEGSFKEREKLIKLIPELNHCYHFQVYFVYKYNVIDFLPLERNRFIILSVYFPIIDFR